MNRLSQRPHHSGVCAIGNAIGCANVIGDAVSTREAYDSRGFLAGNGPIDRTGTPLAHVIHKRVRGTVFGTATGSGSLKQLHKLHAIFSEKSKAQAAMDLMISTGSFRRNQLILVEVPRLVDTEQAHARIHRQPLVEMLQPFRIAGLAGGMLLVGAISYSILHGVGLEGASYPLIFASAIVGAYAGLLGGWTGYWRKSSAVSGFGRSGPGNWVLIVIAHDAQGANLAEELLASTRLPSKLRIPRKGIVARATAIPWPQTVPVNASRRRAGMT